MTIKIEIGLESEVRVIAQRYCSKQCMYMVWQGM